LNRCFYLLFILLKCRKTGHHFIPFTVFQKHYTSFLAIAFVKTESDNQDTQPDYGNQRIITKPIVIVKYAFPFNFNMVNVNS
ncbi:MAG: hypothetical protein KDE52_17455, partial [Calditrichaeota bacterium]|nr:hypothetical protein [Calditrichota bacterium]